MEFLVSIWPYFTVFLFFSNRALQVVLNRKSPQEYPVNAGLPLGSILGLTLFRLCMIDLHDDVILLSTLVVVMYLICGNN